MVGAAPRGRCRAPRTVVERPQPWPSGRPGEPPAAAGSSPLGPRGSWGWWRPPGQGGRRRPGHRSDPTCPGAGGCCGRGGRPRPPEPVGAGETGQAGPVGAGAFDPDALHRPETLGPGDQGDIAAGRGRERLGAAQPPAWSMTAATWVSRWVSTPTVTALARCWHALHDRSFRADRTGTARPIGTVDSTATGPLARLLSGHSARPVGAFMRPPAAGRQIKLKAPGR